MERYSVPEILIGILAEAAALGWVAPFVLAVVFNSLPMFLIGILWLIVLIIVAMKLPWRD